MRFDQLVPTRSWTSEYCWALNCKPCRVHRDQRWSKRSWRWCCRTRQYKARLRSSVRTSRRATNANRTKRRSNRLQKDSTTSSSQPLHPPPSQTTSDLTQTLLQKKKKKTKQNKKKVTNNKDSSSSSEVRCFSLRFCFAFITKLEKERMKWRLKNLHWRKSPSFSVLRNQIKISAFLGRFWNSLFFYGGIPSRLLANAFMERRWRIASTIDTWT